MHKEKHKAKHRKRKDSLGSWDAMSPLFIKHIFLLQSGCAARGMQLMMLLALGR